MRIVQIFGLFLEDIFLFFIWNHFYKKIHLYKNLKLK